MLRIQRMNKNDEQLGYILSRLETLSDQIEQNSTSIDELKEDLIKRTMFYKIITWVMGLMTMLVVYFLAHILGWNK